MFSKTLQTADYRLVGGKNREVRKFSWMDPAMLGNPDITEIICEKLAIIRKNQHRSPLVTIKCHFKNPCNLNFCVKLFTDFAVQGLLRAFARINFPAGELPETGMTLVIRTTGDEDSGPIENNRSSDQ
jgi:hypothetical protein